MTLRLIVGIVFSLVVVVLAVWLGYIWGSNTSYAPTNTDNNTNTISNTSNGTPSNTSTPSQLGDVAFTKISKGAYSGITEKSENVVKTEPEWKALWTKINSNISPKPPLPAVNFDEDMVIAVFQGTKPNGGYSIQIIKILEKENTIEITARTTVTGGSITTQALTQPYDIVKIKKSAKSVLFNITPLL